MAIVFKEPPEPGQSLEIGPGVHWIRLPMPFRLNHVNVWAIDDGEGWAMVDSGLHADGAVPRWNEHMDQLPSGRHLTRVFATHMHPDHIGMAGWFTSKHDIDLWMTQAEYYACRVLVSDTGKEAPADAVRFYREAGWEEASLEGYRAKFGDFGRFVYPLPQRYVRLTDGQVIRIGTHTWEVVVGRGHSPEHACLYCAQLKLFISGDQVLPKISSNVSVFPTEPFANPMADWFDSLDDIEARVPADVLVLPAHNECFYGLHERLHRLRSGQQEALDRLRALLGQPRRVIDVFPALFRSAIAQSDLSHLGLATGEAIACLNWLVHRGEATRTMRGGVAWYRLE